MGNPTQRTAAKGLVWTERLILLSYMIALIIVTVDATLQMRLGHSALKHLPLIAFVPSFLLHFIGVTLFNYRSVSDGPILKLLWPLLLLSVFALVGSLIARIQFEVRDPFLTLGIYTLAPYIFARVMMSSDNWRALIRWQAILCVISGLAISIAVFRWYTSSTSAPIHESEWLVIPPIVFFLLIKPRRFWTVGLALILIVAAVMGKKNTGYLVLLLTFAYLGAWFVRAKAEDESANLILRRTLIVLTAFAIVSVCVFVWMYRDKYLPSGNLEYRLFQYEIALEEFFASPFWGHAFSKGSGQEFTLWVDPRYSSMVLPTHNDILDIAKAGGLIALTLWFIGVGKVLLPALVRVFRGSKVFATPEMQLMIVSSISAIVVYTFNPILLKPCFALILWSNLGAIAGALLRERAQEQEAESEQLLEGANRAV